MNKDLYKLYITYSALIIQKQQILQRGGSAAEWLAFWTQAQKGPGSNRVWLPLPSPYRGDRVSLYNNLLSPTVIDVCHFVPLSNAKQACVQYVGSASSR